MKINCVAIRLQSRSKFRIQAFNTLQKDGVQKKLVGKEARIEVRAHIRYMQPKLKVVTDTAYRLLIHYKKMGCRKSL